MDTIQYFNPLPYIKDLINYHNDKQNQQRILAIFACYTVYKLIGFTAGKVQKAAIQKKWTRNIKQYNKEREQRLADVLNQVQEPFKQIPQETVTKVIESNLQQLKEMLRNKVITSVDLLNIFTYRSLTIGKSHNLITETNYDEALQMAQDCDIKRNTEPQNCTGELFGIVVSFKENFKVKGTRATLGVACNLQQISDHDGEVTHIIKQQGGIPFVKTNVPQFLMAFHSANFIYGAAQNPWNRERSAGGSSGGEGGLVAASCTPFGIGTDIGGSIRVPAAWNGIVGFKPSNHRMSFNGCQRRSYAALANGPNQTVAGPMTKFVEDSALFMRIMLNRKNYEQIPVSQRIVQPIVEWDEQEYRSTKKMKIGYYQHYQNQQSSPSVERAVMEAKQILEKQGHELVPIQFPFKDETSVIGFRMYGSDGFRDVLDCLQGEDALPVYKQYEKLCGLGPQLRWLISFIFKLTNKTVESNLLKTAKPCTTLEFKTLVGRAKVLQQQVIEFYEKEGLDALLCPGSGLQATKNMAWDIFSHSSFVNIWNLLQFTCGVVPVSQVQKNEQYYKPQELCSESRKIDQDLKTSVGMPVGIQIVTLPLQEEKCLNLMRQVEESVNFWKQPKLVL